MNTCSYVSHISNKQNIYIVHNVVNNMINNKQIKNALEKNPKGLTITKLVEKTKLTRCQIRTALSYLLGSGEIEETKIGMAKLYNLIILEGGIKK